MADVAQNLRTFTLGDTGIAAIVAERMSQDHVPQRFEEAHIWFGRSNTVTNDTLDMSADDGTLQENFNLECACTDQDKVQSLAELVKDRLNGYRGTFGTITVQGAFCSDHSDDYELRNDYSDEGIFVAAMAVEVYLQ